MTQIYEQMTGFQSACAEFHEKELSLDERYLTNRPSMFLIEVGDDSKRHNVFKGNKLLIDRSLKPREKDLVLMVMGNEFKLVHFSWKMLEGQDPETGDFVWGVVKTIIQELR